ncbi:MAG: pyridoxal phosphate-dependent transferase [Benniella sp.]|nr:MAG: pyridoxal phosphate-dependent transferase [Benniella sp.]
MALPDNPKTIAALLDRVAHHTASRFEDLSNPQQRQTLPLQPFPSFTTTTATTTTTTTTTTSTLPPQQQQQPPSQDQGSGSVQETRAHAAAAAGNNKTVVDPATQSFLSIELTQQGVGLESTVEELLSRIGPSMANSTGPRYFGLVTGGVTPAALLADWVVSTYDQNTILYSPEAMSGYSVITEQAMKMAVDLFHLPREKEDSDDHHDHHNHHQDDDRDDKEEGTVRTALGTATITTASGVGVGVGGRKESRYFRAMTTTGSTASNVVGMAVGRQWLGIHDRGVDYSQEGYDGQVVVLTNMAHASVWKAASILGIGRRQVVEIPGMGVTKEDEKEQTLEKEVKKWKEAGKSVMVFLAFGEVNTGIFARNTRRIAQICHQHHAYLHIDGAFGIYARCSPQYAPLADGLELAHSITACGHKWLNVPYDCGLFLYRQSLEKTIMEPLFSSTAAYLRPSGTRFSHPMNISIENSQRFRELPVWATLRAYGREGYCKIVEENCRFARTMYDWMKGVRPDLYTVLTEECPLNIVVFCQTPPSSSSSSSVGGDGQEGMEALEERNTLLLKRINETGVAYFSPTVWKGRPAIRAAISNWKTTVELDWEPVRIMLEEQATALAIQ